MCFIGRIIHKKCESLGCYWGWMTGTHLEFTIKIRCWLRIWNDRLDLNTHYGIIFFAFDTSTVKNGLDFDRKIKKTLWVNKNYITRFIFKELDWIILFFRKILVKFFGMYKKLIFWPPPSSSHNFYASLEMYDGPFHLTKPYQPKLPSPLLPQKTFKLEKTTAKKV